MKSTRNNPACANKRDTTKPKKPVYSNNSKSQRQRILQFFEAEKRPLSTFYFRERGILHPGGRIKELRDRGYKILTYYVHAPDANGVLHRIGFYSYHGVVKEGKRWLVL